MASLAVNPELSSPVRSDPEIASGAIYLYHLYEISEAIDLGKLQELLGPDSSQARIAFKPFKNTAPQHLQFQNPPVVIPGPAVPWNSRCRFQARVKFYDYGVASVTLEAPFAGEWEELVSLAAEIVGNPDLEKAATAVLERYVRQLRPAFTKPAASWMVEDYAIFAVHRFRSPKSASELVAGHGPAIARLVRSERAPLSDAEVSEAIRDALSYQPHDLAVIGWNAAFLVDSAAGEVEATAEILEFANSQLLEFRHYDALLDAELAGVYEDLETGEGATRLFRSYRYRKAARRLSALYLDVSELTEKTENSLKFFGDLYAARLYRVAAQKLGLTEWKTLVNRKLQSAASLYRSLLDEVTSLRMQFMEFAIVLILVFELLMKLTGPA